MFICVLDYENLDNPLFLKSFAETLKKVSPEQCIILHADSAYTDRIVQTGVMRHEAQLRSIQDLNHRLITFFADYGLPCIGINGFQRGTVEIEENNRININATFINSLPKRTYLVLSSLGLHQSSQKIRPIPLPILIQEVSVQLGIEPIYVFDTDKKSHFVADFDSTLRKITFKSLVDEKDIPNTFPRDLIGLTLSHYICKPLFNIHINKFHATTYVSHKD